MRKDINVSARNREEPQVSKVHRYRINVDVNVEQPKFDRNNVRSVSEAIRFPLFLLLLRDIRLQKEMLTFSNK